MIKLKFLSEFAFWNNYGIISKSKKLKYMNYFKEFLITFVFDICIYNMVFIKYISKVAKVILFLIMSYKHT